MTSEEILKRLNIQDYIIKPKRGLVKDIWLSEFYLAILNTKSGLEAAKSLGFSEQTFNRLVRKIFPGIRLSGRQSWKYYLHELASVYRCYRCDTCKDIKEFNKDSSRRIGTSDICRVCQADKNNSEDRRIKNRQHYIDNIDLYKRKNSINKTRLKNRTPKWADLKAIKEFYSKCPEGHHVDHIIPLNGKFVSGLHVLENLQYLTVEDNLKKSNKFEI